MPELKELLDREVADLVPPDAWEPVQRRAKRRHRNRRLGAAVVAFAVAAVGVAGAWLVAGNLRSEQRPPAGTPIWTGGRTLYECPDPSTSRPTLSTLCSMRPDGSDRRPFGISRGAVNPPLRFITSPAWSPGGSRIAFAASTSTECGNCYEIYVMDADGTKVRRITGPSNVATFSAFYAHPAWSPDGDWIAIDMPFTGSIAKVRPDGTELTVLTNPRPQGETGPESEVFADSSPAWSPDGRQIAFARTFPDKFESDLFVMDADGSNAYESVSTSEVGGSSIQHPAWSPDGTVIAFSAGGSVWTRLIYNNPLDVGRLTKPVRGEDLAPTWTDGGAQVAFLHSDGRRIDLDSVRADRSGPPGTSNGSTIAADVSFGDMEPDAYTIQPPPGGAAGACLHPGPPEFIACAEALQREALATREAGIGIGPQGSSIDVRLVRGFVYPDGSVESSSHRMLWAVTFRDAAIGNLGLQPPPNRLDWEVDIDARTGKFVSEGPARSGA